MPRSPHHLGLFIFRSFFPGTISAMTTTQIDHHQVGHQRRESDQLGSAGWAAGESERLLSAELPKKWAHTQEVARHAKRVAPGIRPGDQDLLIAAAYLHDIGYAEPLVATGFHPLDGAVYLRSLGLDELACLVAHHTGAHIQAAHRGLADQLAEFRRPTGPVADALTYCDVTSGPTGQPMQPGDRFEEIVDRHGEDSIVAKSRTQARPEMYGMVARTLRRASKAQPPADQLVIVPVRLGCSTLVRIQGELTETTSEQAVSLLLQVLDDAPHAVLIDLALLTGLDQAGAGAITIAARCSPDTPITLIGPQRPRPGPARRHPATNRLRAGSRPDPALRRLTLDGFLAAKGQSASRSQTATSHPDCHTFASPAPPTGAPRRPRTPRPKILIPSVGSWAPEVARGGCFPVDDRALRRVDLGGLRIATRRRTDLAATCVVRRSACAPRSPAGTSCGCKPSRLESREALFIGGAPFAHVACRPAGTHLSPSNATPISAVPPGSSTDPPPVNSTSCVPSPTGDESQTSSVLADVNAPVATRGRARHRSGLILSPAHHRQARPSTPGPSCRPSASSTHPSGSRPYRPSCEVPLLEAVPPSALMAASSTVVVLPRCLPSRKWISAIDGKVPGQGEHGLRLHHRVDRAIRTT